MLQDADSFDPEVNEKREGAFYVWKAAEIEEVLGPERAKEFDQAYMVEPEGARRMGQRALLSWDLPASHRQCTRRCWHGGNAWCYAGQGAG